MTKAYADSRQARRDEGGRSAGVSSLTPIARHLVFIGSTSEPLETLNMFSRIALVALALASLSACTTGGARPVRAFLTCATHADCPALEACEPEDTGSVCRAHGDVTGTGVGCALDTDCPVGEECEVEDTGSFCRYHGTDGGGTGLTCASHEIGRAHV